MARLLKWIFITVGLLAVLVFGLLFYLTVVFDPNTLKPELEKLAREQGVELYMPGDVSWQWYPKLGLTLQQVRVGSEPLVSIGNFSVQVAIRPLLKGQVVVDAISLDELTLNLSLNEQGVGNWESLGLKSGSGDKPGSDPAASPAPAATATETDKRALVLAVERLRVSNASVNWLDRQTSTQASVKQLNLEVDDLNLSGEMFSVRQKSELSYNDWPSIVVHADTLLALEQDLQRIHFEETHVQLRQDANLIKLEAQGDVNLEQFQTNAALKISQFDLRPWLKLLVPEPPAMAAEDALARVGIEARISGADDGWQVDGLKLLLDESQVTGNLAIEGNGALQAALNIDQLNLDRYLPPPVDAPATAAPAAPQDTTLDLSALQDLQAELLLSVAQLQAQQLEFSDLQLAVEAKGGVVKLVDLSAGFYQGNIHLSGNLDARKPTVLVKTNARITGVELQPLLQVIAEEQRLVGAVNGTIAASTDGKTTGELQRSLQATLDLSATNLTLSEVDVERSACELAALVNREASPELAWKGATNLHDVTLKAGLQGSTIKVESMQAGVENLAVAARGDLDYESGKFEFPLDVMFVGEVDATRKCQVREKWRNRLLPLRCKGNLDNLGARTCLPDSKRLDDLLRDEVKDRAKEKVQEKLEKENIKEKLEEKLGPEKGEALDQLLKGILKK